MVQKKNKIANRRTGGNKKQGLVPSTGKSMSMRAVQRMRAGSNEKIVFGMNETGRLGMNMKQTSKVGLTRRVFSPIKELESRVFSPIKELESRAFSPIKELESRAFSPIKQVKQVERMALKATKQDIGDEYTYTLEGKNMDEQSEVLFIPKTARLIEGDNESVCCLTGGDTIEIGIFEPYNDEDNKNGIHVSINDKMYTALLPTRRKMVDTNTYMYEFF